MKPGFDGNFTILEPDTLEEGGERRTVVRNYTNDRVAILFRAGTLSTQEEYAARRFQAIRERAEIGSVRGQDHKRVFQDRDVVAGRDSHLPGQCAWALDRIRGIKRRMTPVNFRIVRLVAWENMDTAELLLRFPRYRSHSISARVGEAFEELCNVIDMD